MGSRETRKKWSWMEDELLINAWLNTNKDITANTVQPSKDPPSNSFWKRIEEYYMANKPENAVPRRLTQCKNRWSKICKAVKKFIRCYEKAERNKHSEQSSTNVFNLAKKIYSNYGNDKEFIHEGAWRILKNEPKWMASYSKSSENSGGSSKRTKTNENGGYSGSCPAIPYSDSDDLTPPIHSARVKVGKKMEKPVGNETFSSSSTSKDETSGEYSASLNRAAVDKEQSLKQEPEKLQAILKTKKLEKMVKKFDMEAKKFNKEAREIQVRGKKMDFLIMLMAKGDNLSEEERVVKSKLLREMF
ncbi:glutathione S-transferase T3-like [Andrographis paniculata]|uniref:glutathione S-transferase T3-like n=1 Tax=Andrographis paniculata TaxID=175694 RepID=UPI0021E9ABDF|nr:glutathione S-transferase T3-like [Andrographis paniculata]